jgi:hypothetical protein
MQDEGEPSLGSIERPCSNYGAGNDRTGDQSLWADGPREDLEEEHDGAEPDEDGEPSLGAFEGHENQNIGWSGETCVVDAEMDHAESGIGDQDGLDKQAPMDDWTHRGMV